jgi:hypothetical protein
MAAEIEPAFCPNCGAALGGAYCAACGQKVGALNPTVGEFLRDFTQELLNVDGRIFSSLRLLLTRPGFLTLEQFAGRRIRYVSPIRLYLLFSLVFFATMQLAPSRVRVEITRADEPAAQVVDELRTRQAVAAVDTAMSVWVPRAMFLLVPAFAGLVMLLRRRSGMNYLQHLYFALHVHAAWYCAFTVTLLANLAPRQLHVDVVVGLAMTLYAGAYFWLAFRRVYATTLGGAFWRALVIGAAYWVIVVAIVLAVAFPPALRFATSGP